MRTRAVIHVAGPPGAGKTTLVEAFERFLASMFGNLPWLSRRHSALPADTRAQLLTGIAKIRAMPSAAPTEHWAVHDGCQGIEHAGLVVVNVGRAATQKAPDACSPTCCGCASRRRSSTTSSGSAKPRSAITFPELGVTAIRGFPAIYQFNVLFE
jgi:energy-coupling factor transporter ATP-binding protein EcfA2